MHFYRNLGARKEEVRRLIEEQGKLTAELEAEILHASTLTRIDDIYRPYRPKRKTRASVAREKGLEPLAAYLLSPPDRGDVKETAAQYLSPQVPTPEEALQGAMDIIAENISDDARVRGWVRDYTRRHGILCYRSKR